MKHNNEIGITYYIPKKTYYGLKEYLNIDCRKLNSLISACAINRLIDKGYLNEFGEPIVLPKLDISSISFPENTNFSISSIHEISK